MKKLGFQILFSLKIWFETMQKTAKLNFPLNCKIIIDWVCWWQTCSSYFLVQTALLYPIITPWHSSYFVRLQKWKVENKIKGTSQQTFFRVITSFWVLYRNSRNKKYLKRPRVYNQTKNFPKNSIYDTCETSLIIQMFRAYSYFNGNNDIFTASCPLSKTELSQLIQLGLS